MRYGPGVLVLVTSITAATSLVRAEAFSELVVFGDSFTDTGTPWEGGLTFHPPRYAKTFQSWHENLRDWCISRQLWWGHRIPVWTAAATPDTESQPHHPGNIPGDRPGCNRS